MYKTAEYSRLEALKREVDSMTNFVDLARRLRTMAVCGGSVTIDVRAPHFGTDRDSILIPAGLRKAVLLQVAEMMEARARESAAGAVRLMATPIDVSQAAKV